MVIYSWFFFENVEQFVAMCHMQWYDPHTLDYFIKIKILLGKVLNKA